ncbi:FAD-dependent monooxygenase [Staphylospora marina]|uniref:FAD-dependent monooxygenase n=1 Tax=Staphylospora marina TaxID=2490858 RepID=UPI000F5C1AB9|nr:FAD-dependent monooxygenase [Staphylospora marina]
MEKKKVLVIGGGIAGLAVACFLKRIGMEPVVFESREEPDAYSGLFLNVAANGLRVLRMLGVDERIAAEGFPCSRMMMWSGSGKRLGVVSNGTRDHAGTVIKRKDLERILREHARHAGVDVAYGKKLTDLKVDETGVTAFFGDGTKERGDLLVGSDGIHSATRRIIDPEAPDPGYTGLLSVGGFTKVPGLSPTIGEQHMMFGKRAFFGHLVREDGEVYWFANVEYPGNPTRRELSRIPSEEWKRKLTELFADDKGPAATIISSTSEIGVFPIHDILHQRVWHKGPVVLIGDAVHATSPNSGQGASLALEDALVLAKCIRDIPDPSAAFARFEELRRDRAEKVVEYSRKLGNTKTVSNPVARWFRDLVMPVALKWFANPDSLKWLVEYELDWDEPVEG